MYYDNILNYIKRPELTEQNKQFYAMRYLARSLLNISITVFIFKVLTRNRYKTIPIFFACYYFGFSLRKINNLLIKSQEEYEFRIKSPELINKKITEIADIQNDNDDSSKL